MTECLGLNEKERPLTFAFDRPTSLETWVLDQDGRIAKRDRPNGNAFKSTRLVRNGMTMGTLFSLRMTCFNDQKKSAQ